MPQARPIFLSAFTMSAVSHLNYGLWRHPDDQSWRYNQLTHWTALARAVEAAGFDTLFIADALGLLDTYAGSADASLRTGTQSPLSDPLLTVSAMAAVTQHLGFGVTVSTTYEHPYLLARKFTTLDHLSNGRIGWNIVTSQLESAARNLGLGQQIEHDERYDGSGYPASTSGDAISLRAMIVGCAATWVALTSHRPYRATLGNDAALYLMTVGQENKFPHTILAGLRQATRETELARLTA